MKKRYKGFISYNQLDKKIARRIHKTLDTYCIPRGITPTDAATRKLGRFFIDAIQPDKKIHSEKPQPYSAQRAGHRGVSRESYADLQQ